MPAGRPQKAHPGDLWVFAEQFYWDFRKLAEGRLISRLDEEEYKRLLDGIDNTEIKLNMDQAVALAKVVTDEVARGRIKPEDKSNRLREAAKDNIAVTREWLRWQAVDQARKPVRIPGKPDIVRALFEAKTADQVKSICQDAFVPRTINTAYGATKEVMWPNWPISIGSVLPMYLSQYAARFIAAKNDERFPRSNRPTTLLKQLWFLSRALSGALHGVEVRTAINLVGSKRPEEMFDESRAAKPARRRAKAFQRKDH